MIESHRDLLVWQKAVDLVVDCYDVCRQFPDSERFGLTSQIRRAASSIPANIAEGKARGTTGAFINYLSIADGSLAELDTHWEVAVRLKYITRDQQQHLSLKMSEIGRMLTGLRHSLEKHLQ